LLCATWLWGRMASGGRLVIGLSGICIPLVARCFVLLSLRVFARSDDFVQPARCGNCSITEPACLRARLCRPTLIPQLLRSRDRTRALASKGVGFGSPIRLNFPTPPLRADY